MHKLIKTIVGCGALASLTSFSALADNNNGDTINSIQKIVDAANINIDVAATAAATLQNAEIASGTSLASLPIGVATSLGSVLLPSMAAGAGAFSAAIPSLAATGISSEILQNPGGVQAGLDQMFKQINDYVLTQS